MLQLDDKTLMCKIVFFPWKIVVPCCEWLTLGTQWRLAVVYKLLAKLRCWVQQKSADIDWCKSILIL